MNIFQSISNIYIAGQIERTPKKDDILPDLLQELTTKMTFTPNTHRTIQLNPHTSSSVPVKSGGNGFLGLFATLSNNPDTAISSTSAPLYLGDIDMEELKKFQNFQEVQNSNSDVAKYLKIKDLLESLGSKQSLEERKKASRQKIMDKLLQNRRLSVEDDSDEKINALQMLVRSNIDTSLQTQHQSQQVAGSGGSFGHMSQYMVPAADHLNMKYTSQVEKPSLQSGAQQAAMSGPLQNLPFLAPEPGPYNSVMINPSPGVDITPNPINTNVQSSTLPFLDIHPPSNNLNYNSNIRQQPLVLNNYNNDYLMKGPQQQSTIHGPQNLYNVKANSMQNSYSSYPKQSPNIENMYGTSFVTPINTQNYVQNYPTLPPIYIPPQNMITTRLPLRRNDLGNQLLMAENEQRELESQLAQLKQVKQNMKENTYPKPPLVLSPSVNYPQMKSNDVKTLLHKPMSGFPMNFEDMLSTGLKLAQQSNKNSLYNQNVAEIIHPRNSQPSPQTSWSSVPIPSMTHDKYPSNIQSADDFNPSKQISQNFVQSNLDYTKMPESSTKRNELETNSIDSEQIHIIGPNCYIMSNNGFKYVGKAPNCLPTMTVKDEDENKKEDSKINRRKHGRSGSIWDSITSIPFVNKFARSFGIK